jgi:hypothetical protein
MERRSIPCIEDVKQDDLVGGEIVDPVVIEDLVIDHRPQGACGQ